jgi:hypothetical protein
MSSGTPKIRQQANARPTPDKRTAVRRPLERVVRIARLSMVNCLLADVSPSGARLKIDGDLLPDEFMLVLQDDVHRWCKTMWRRDNEAGVKFVDLSATEPTVQVPLRRLKSRP